MLTMTNEATEPKEEYRQKVKKWITSGMYELRPMKPYEVSEDEARQIRIDELYAWFHPKKE